jgi:hypothetical protein
MNILKQIFRNSKSDERKGAFFGSTERELKQFFVDLGQVTFGSDFLAFKNYPFEHSVVSTNQTIASKGILNVCIKSSPPTIRVDNDLIFISAMQKQDLAEFADRNKIPLSDRPELWDWILEPFLDTEFDDEHKERIYILLEKYQLDRLTVDCLRRTVKEQMMKYNFDTMLWEWGMFGALDVLEAMRPNLSTENFKAFYKQVMEIALRPDTIDQKPSH